MSARTPDNGTGSIFRELQVVWRLLQDERVPGWLKLGPLLSLLYLVWPLDLIADPALGIGQLDDLLIIVISLVLLRYLGPRTSALEAESRETALSRGDDEEEAIGSSYRVLDD